MHRPKLIEYILMTVSHRCCFRFKLRFLQLGDNIGFMLHLLILFDTHHNHISITIFG